jgi:hypothetical protein
MILNLLALLILLGLIATGVAVIVRALLEPPPGSNTRCAACGRDAADLVDFTCPGCGRDVRDGGLTSTPLDSPVARFWRAAAITCVAVAAFGFTSSVMWLLVPTTRIHDVSVDLQPNFLTAIESIEMKFEGVSPGGRRGDDAENVVRGRLVADLAVAEGRMTTLEVRFPEGAARVTDENGHGAAAERPLTEAAVRAWLEAAGVDTRAEAFDSVVRELQQRIGRMGQGWRPSDDEHEHARSRALFSGGRGASSYERVPAWLAPVSAIAWAVVWLLALRRWLRRRVARDGAGDTRAEATAPRQMAVPA